MHLDLICNMQIEKLKELAVEQSAPCVSISLNTHRTHPDNAQDSIVLKNLLKEAHDRVTHEFGKRDVTQLLEKIENIEQEIDVNYNLDSLHIFLSNKTKEIIKSPWRVNKNTVQIADHFAIKPLIKILNRTENYHILLLSQSGVNLFHAQNDVISEEIKNEDFPFDQNPHYSTHSGELSDAKQVDNLVREFLNTVDKAVVKVFHKTGLKCVVICTEDNHSRLMQVADLPSVYLEYVKINYNDVANHTLALSAWKVVEALQQKNRTEAIHEMQEAVGKGNVLTDLSEIYRAAKEGRGDLLIVHNDYSQAVKMKDENTFELIEDATQEGAIDDVTNEIAWEVISKKGRAIFTDQEEIKSLGNIVLKVRY